MVLNRDYEGIVTDGLILDWDVGFIPSYPKNGSIIRDLSGSNSDGNIYNGVSYDSNNGGSLVFDGSDDDVYPSTDLSSLPSGDSARTMMYWIYPYSLSSTILRQIAGWGLDNGRGNLFCGIIYSNGKAGLWGNSINYQSTHNITNNTWQHIAYVKTPGNIVCYKNGVADSGGSLTLNTVTNSRPYMGKVYNKNIYSLYTGRIGNFLIYDRDLSSTEILQNFNAQKGRFGL
jgi:hypothetical protein